MDKVDYTLQYKKWHRDDLSHYEASVQYYQRTLLPHLPPDRYCSILAVGCGFGLAMFAAKKFGYTNIQGIDISQQQVEVAKKYGLEAECVEDTTTWLKTRVGCFDAVLLLDVLEHIKTDRQLEFLRAIHGSLKANGVLICTVPNANSVFGGRWRYIDWTHYASFCEHSLEFVLRVAGFVEVRVMEIEFFTRPKLPLLIRKSVLHWILFKAMRLLRRLEAIAELGSEGKQIPLSLNIMATAKK